MFITRKRRERKRGGPGSMAEPELRIDLENLDLVGAKGESVIGLENKKS